MASASSGAGAQERLTVATYGGNCGEAQKACILDPFAKASGVPVVQETSVSTVTYNKLKQQKGNPSIDIAWIEHGVIQGAAESVCPEPAGTADADLTSYVSPVPVTYVLEVPAGWLDTNGLGIGTHVEGLPSLVSQ